MSRAALRIAAALSLLAAPLRADVIISSGFTIEKDGRRIVISPLPQEKDIYIRLAQEGNDMTISLVRLFCGPGRISGYSGFSRKVPSSGSFSTGVSLAMGPFAMRMLVEVHSWLFEDMPSEMRASPDAIGSICTEDGRARLLDYDVFALSKIGRQGPFRFELKKSFFLREPFLEISWD